MPGLRREAEAPRMKKHKSCLQTHKEQELPREYRSQSSLPCGMPTGATVVHVDLTWGFDGDRRQV